MLISYIGCTCTGFASVFELTLSVFRLILQARTIGTSSHIAILAYFCDRANSTSPLESGRSVALLGTKIWRKSRTEPVSFISSIFICLASMAADILKLDRLTCFKETHSTLSFMLKFWFTWYFGENIAVRLLEISYFTWFPVQVLNCSGNEKRNKSLIGQSQVTWYL